MIKFFSKIRQRLLSENKLSKYLIYAIGEIILVIIGILIALGINENAKEKNNLQQRNLYIIQLNDEVNRNLDLLTYHENYINEMIQEVDTLIQIITNNEYDNPNLFSKSRILINNNSFNPIMVTYENLKSSGDLKLFKDLKLRNSISEPYETFNQIKIAESIDRKGTESYFYDFLMQKANFIDTKNSVLDFAKETYFHNTVFARRVTLSQLKNTYKNSIKSLKDLKSTLEELEKDNKK